MLDTPTQRQLADHLLQHRRAEDVCFALYRPSAGSERFSGIVQQPILPQEGERQVHGNASVTAGYFERALGEAVAADAGLVFLHSHGRGSGGWQGMSGDDIETESTYAPRALAMTDLPLLGMTIAGDETWSARFWERTARNKYRRADCESVRVIGEALTLSYHPHLRPAPGFREALGRTISAWGKPVQDDFARLRIGVIGLGNVGAIVAEALARSGVQHLLLIDFDSIKLHNLDRILYATDRDVRLGRSKVELMARALRRSATAANPLIEPLELSVVEEDGFRAALDCDVLFSCVDRPWPRAVLNLIAYAHGIPVVDGGIRVTVENGRMASVDWKAHIAAPGRRCLQCLEQYRAAYVGLEQQGDLDDPSYIAGLPPDSTLLANQNVFAFGLGAGSLEVVQLIGMLAMPGVASDIGSQHYNIKTGKIDIEPRGCEHNCDYSGSYLAVGDQAPINPLGTHTAAHREMAERQLMRNRWQARLGRWVDDFVDNRIH